LWPGTVEKLEDLKTDSLQWVLPVLGEQFWTEPAIRMGLKVTNESLPYWVGVKHFPDPYYQLTRPPLADTTGRFVLLRQYQNEYLYLDSTAEYAYVAGSDGNFYTCSSAGAAGYINVTCNVPVNGYLTVRENIWPGWMVWMDGESIELFDANGWMETKSPAGLHVFHFRFLPRDAPISLFLWFSGMLYCIWLWTYKTGDPTPLRRIMNFLNQKWLQRKKLDILVQGK
jgi:hypothetical protein